MVEPIQVMTCAVLLKYKNNLNNSNNIRNLCISTNCTKTKLHHKYRIYQYHNCNILLVQYISASILVTEIVINRYTVYIVIL